MAKKFALIIGIENYPGVSGQPKACYAQNDARAMAEYARQAGFHLIGGKAILDNEATNIKIIDWLELLFKHAASEDFILIYFAGHGDVNEYGGHLIPYDFQQENAVNESTCISYDSIDRRLENKKTKQFIFFLDACHSGFAGKEVNIRSSTSRDIRVSSEARKKLEIQMNNMLKKEGGSKNVGRLIFTSSSPEEKSYPIDEFQHGLFTYYLLSGLKTTRQEEKTVNAEDLVRYVKENVLTFCLDKNLVQTPTAYTNIQGKFLIPAYQVRPLEGEVVLAPDFSGKIKEARKELETGNFDSAEQIINKILEEDRLNSDAIRLLRELETKRSLAREKQDIEKRKNYEEWLRRGEAFMKTGDSQKASECFENAARIFPDSEVVRSYLKDISTREHIVKQDDIVAPKGDKLTILKNLFPVAETAVKEKAFTDALNLYNKILKIYPGNEKAEKEKKELFITWLQDYKDEKRYFEMLGLLDDVILPDKSMQNNVEAFQKIYDDVLLMYTQEFIKSRTRIELDNLYQDMMDKEKLIIRYEKLLDEYREMAMETERNELQKVNKKLIHERDAIKEKIAQKSALLENPNLFNVDKKMFRALDVVTLLLKSIIEDGITDRYILRAYHPIQLMNVRAKLDFIRNMEEENNDQINKKAILLRNLKEVFPGILTEEIDEEKRRLRIILDVRRIWEMDEGDMEAWVKKLKMLEGIEKKHYDWVALAIENKILRLREKIRSQKMKNWEKKYIIYHSFSMSIYVLCNIYISFLVIKNYIEKKGFFNILGVVLFGCGVIYAFMMGIALLSGRVTTEKDKKIRGIVLLELSKIFCVSSLPAFAYRIMTKSPEHFFTLNTLWFLPATILFFIAVSGIDD